MMKWVILLTAVSQVAFICIALAYLKWLEKYIWDLHKRIISLEVESKIVIKPQIRDLYKKIDDARKEEAKDEPAV